MKNIYTDFVSFFSNFVLTCKTSFQINSGILISPKVKETKDIHCKATQLSFSTIFSPLILSCGDERQCSRLYRHCCFNLCF